MKRRRAASAVRDSPARQVAGFIAKFDPAIAKLVRASRKALRKRLPTAVELVYDNYNALAIGWGPNERTSEVIVSLGIFARGICLYFTQGTRLPDPQKLLKGSGKQGRFLRLDRVSLLEEPPVEALLRAAIRLGKTPLPATGRGTTVVKSVSAKQRPRRPVQPPNRPRPARAVRRGQRR
jgi:hypothetical protein